MPRLALKARRYTFVLLVLAVVAFFVYSALIVSFPYTLDYGEAPLLDRAVRLIEGQVIYRNHLSGPPYIITNYPPLYIVSLVPAVRLGGPRVGLVAGRLLSVGCAGLSALFIGLIVRTHSKDRMAALEAALTFLAIPYTVSWSAYLRVDMMALALSLGALYVITTWGGKRWGVLIAAVLLTLAVYTRQSYGLAAPLAAFVWLWRKYGVGRALFLASVVMLLGIPTFFVLNAVTAGGFAYNLITANVNQFEWQTVWISVRQIGLTMPVLLLVALGWGVVSERDFTLKPLVLSYLLGSAMSASTIGKVGSNVNYLLELGAALSMASSLAYGRAVPRIQLIGNLSTKLAEHKSAMRYGASVAMAIQAAILFGLGVRYSVNHLQWRAQVIDELDTLDVMIAQAPDPVIADQFMGLLTLQGRQLYLQPFEVTQLARSGDWNQQPLLEDTMSRCFSLVFIDARDLRESRWTPEMLQAINENYTVTKQLAGSTIYQPNSAADARCSSSSSW